MMEQARSILFVSVLGVCSDLSAQESPDAATQSAARDAEEFAHCLVELDSECVSRLTHDELMTVVTGSSVPLSTRLERAKQLESEGQFGSNRISMDLTQPWEPFAVGDRLYTFVPSREVRVTFEGIEEEVDFLIGISDNDGESWRFVFGNSGNRINRVIPGYRGGLLPETSERTIRGPGRARSRYLTTIDGGFEFAEGTASYVMEFRVRRSSDSEVVLVAMFDDPSDSSQQAVVRTVLAPDQQEVQIRSPMLTGFERGAFYDVSVYGVDAETGEGLFEHRQQLLFLPTFENWKLLSSER